MNKRTSRKRTSRKRTSHKRTSRKRTSRKRTSRKRKLKGGGSLQDYLQHLKQCFSELRGKDLDPFLTMDRSDLEREMDKGKYEYFKNHLSLMKSGITDCNAIKLKIKLSIQNLYDWYLYQLVNGEKDGYHFKLGDDKIALDICSGYEDPMTDPKKGYKIKEQEGKIAIAKGVNHNGLFLEFESKEERDGVFAEVSEMYSKGGGSYGEVLVGETNMNLLFNVKSYSSVFFCEKATKKIFEKIHQYFLNGFFHDLLQNLSNTLYNLSLYTMDYFSSNFRGEFLYNSSNYQSIKDHLNLDPDLDSSQILLIDSDGYILLLYDSNGWQLPGGLKDHGESIFDAGIREFVEETGTKLLKEDDPLLIATSRGKQNENANSDINWEAIFCGFFMSEKTPTFHSHIFYTQKKFKEEFNEIVENYYKIYPKDDKREHTHCSYFKMKSDGKLKMMKNNMEVDLEPGEKFREKTVESLEFVNRYLSPTYEKREKSFDEKLRIPAILN